MRITDSHAASHDLLPDRAAVGVGDARQRGCGDAVVTVSRGKSRSTGKPIMGRCRDFRPSSRMPRSANPDVHPRGVGKRRVFGGSRGRRRGTGQTREPGRQLQELSEVTHCGDGRTSSTVPKRYREAMGGRRESCSPACSQAVPVRSAILCVAPWIGTGLQGMVPARILVPRR